ncbi:hypothetical protein HGB07_00150, partial [Candidatus Roizmanbacteria bacterium]|nr:hypothetical protein [Candidatus Roizmanbacteria bacterium]
MYSQRGEIATVLTLGALVVLGITTLVGTIFMNKTTVGTQKSKAAEQTCQTEMTIDGVKWKVDCDPTRWCVGNETNTLTSTDYPSEFAGALSDKAICKAVFVNHGGVSSSEPLSNFWCYGFSGAASPGYKNFRCMHLSNASAWVSPTPTSPPQAQPTTPPAQNQPIPTTAWATHSCDDLPQNIRDSWDCFDTIAGQSYQPGCTNTNSDLSGEVSCRTLFANRGQTTTNQKYWCYGLPQGSRCLQLKANAVPTAFPTPTPAPANNCYYNGTKYYQNQTVCYSGSPKVCSLNAASYTLSFTDTSASGICASPTAAGGGGTGPGATGTPKGATPTPTTNACKYSCVQSLSNCNSTEGGTYISSQTCAGGNKCCKFDGTKSCTTDTECTSTEFCNWDNKCYSTSNSAVCHLSVNDGTTQKTIYALTSGVDLVKKDDGTCEAQSYFGCTELLPATAVSFMKGAPAGCVYDPYYADSVNRNKVSYCHEDTLNNKTPTSKTRGAYVTDISCVGLWHPLTDTPQGYGYINPNAMGIADSACFIKDDDDSESSGEIVYDSNLNLTLKLTECSPNKCERSTGKCIPNAASTPPKATATPDPATPQPTATPAGSKTATTYTCTCDTNDFDRRKFKCVDNKNNNANIDPNVHGGIGYCSRANDNQEFCLGSTTIADITAPVWPCYKKTKITSYVDSSKPDNSCLTQNNYQLALTNNAGVDLITPIPVSKLITKTTLVTMDYKIMTTQYADEFIPDGKNDYVKHPEIYIDLYIFKKDLRNDQIEILPVKGSYMSFVPKSTKEYQVVIDST